MQIHLKSLLLILALQVPVMASAAPVSTAIGDRSSDSSLEQGKQLISKGDYTNAVSALTQAIEKEPDNVEAHEYRAGAYFGCRKWQDALKDINYVIERQPGNGRAHSSRSSIYHALGQDDQAVAELNESLRIDPSDYLSFQKRAALLSGKGELDRAIDDWTESLRLQPSHDHAFASRGHAYFRIGRFDLAAKDYYAALKLNKTNDFALNNLAWLRATCPDATWRDGKEAVMLATKACELTAWKNADWIDTLAAGCAEAGDFPKAIEFEKRALNIADLPKDARDELQEHLARYTQNKPLRSTSPNKRD